MDKARHEIQEPNDLLAESEGEPGQRKFRIVAVSTTGSAILWVEKEQLYQLAIAIKQLLAMVKQPDDPDTNLVQDQEFYTNIEFKAGGLKLREDNSNKRIVIDAKDISPDTEFETTLRIWVTNAKARIFAEDCLNVCALGRPLCPLCTEPIENDTHVCPRSNGHAVYLQQ